MKDEYDFSKGKRGAILPKAKTPGEVLPDLRAIRDELNEALAGKSFAEQQEFIRKALSPQQRQPGGRHSRRRPTG
jgi:hypothetical protein